MFGKQGLRTVHVIGLGWLGIAAAIFAIQLTNRPSIMVTWATESEQETAGFHVYRSESAAGPFNRINQAMIPAKGNTVDGAAYEFIDRDVAAGTTYFYQLAEVELDASIVRYANKTINHRAVRFSWWHVGITAVSAIIGIVLLTTNRTDK